MTLFITIQEQEPVYFRHFQQVIMGEKVHIKNSFICPLKCFSNKSSLQQRVETWGEDHSSSDVKERNEFPDASRSEHGAGQCFDCQHVSSGTTQAAPTFSCGSIYSDLTLHIHWSQTVTTKSQTPTRNLNLTLVLLHVSNNDLDPVLL